MKPLPTALTLFICTCAMAQATSLSLNSLFSDHAVLQRERPLTIWGQASPGTLVEVTLGDQSGHTDTDAHGVWRVVLPALEAGGPYQLSVKGDETHIVREDILIGDVWLASGQSNMGWSIGHGVTDQEQTIATAIDDRIRQLKVTETASTVLETEAATTGWQVCSPAAVTSFSAVAYYFAQELRPATQVPIGIINSTWGGSSIEAWMTPEAIGELPHLKGPEIPEIRGGDVSLRDFSATNDERIQTITTLVKSSQEALAAGVLEPDFDDSTSNVGGLPGWLELTHNIIWMRKSFELTEPPSGPIEITLGHAPSFGSIYLNGELLTAVDNKPLVARFDGSLLQPGRNQLAVRLGDNWFPPFLMGDTANAGLRALEGSWEIPLVDDWQRHEFLEPKLPTYHALQTIPSALFNAMIHPLLGFEFKGVIWYQGENNGNNGIEYRDLFPAMITDWRKQFKAPDLPFLWVQLANHGTPALHEYSGWPFLREAQARALTLPATGMAVTIDLGEAMDIHPRNKADVGRRLALQARRVAYHESLPATGPTLRRAVFEDGHIELHFDYADGLHTLVNAPVSGFVVAGSDKTFHPARAKIAGSTIQLICDAVPHPASVRYAWAQNPPVNLYNQHGLPAVPFRTDNWDPVVHEEN